MRPIHPLAAALALLTGCATQHEPGWQGSNAHAFGTAKLICKSEAKAVARVERDMVYRACMLRHGWLQPPKDAR